MGPDTEETEAQVKDWAQVRERWWSRTVGVRQGHPEEEGTTVWSQLESWTGPEAVVSPSAGQPYPRPVTGASLATS